MDATVVTFPFRPQLVGQPCKVIKYCDPTNVLVQFDSGQQHVVRKWCLRFHNDEGVPTEEPDRPVDYYTLPETRAMQVAVAKDVLSQINLGICRPTRYQYLRLSSGSLPASTEELRSIECYACAIGSTFISAIGLYNSFDVSKFVRDQDVVSCDLIEMWEALLHVFSYTTLEDMEALFEAWGPNKPLSSYPAVTRLEMIMQDIINNNGQLTLKP